MPSRRQVRTALDKSIPPVPVTENTPIKVSASAVEVAKRWTGKKRTASHDVFRAPDFPPSVAPKAGIAQDEALPDMFNWAANNYVYDAWVEGMSFLGYTYLSTLAQRPEYRVISEEIASEMTREWIELKSSGDDKKEEKIAELRTALDKLKVREAFHKAATHDGFFGRGHIYLDTGDTDDRDELKTPLGDGHNNTSKSKIAKGQLKAVRVVEPVWVYPNQYNSTNPLKADWYRPETWVVMGTEVHRSRLLTFVGREVPDMLKPAYAFGGLAMTQMVRPYVDNWLRTRQSVSDLLHSFSTKVLKTNIGADLQAGSVLFNRVDMFNAMADNRGTLVIDKEREEFANVSAPLGTLDHLQAQAQEQMASISRVPIVKLLGIQPSGLNASSEGEIRSFYDWIKAFQRAMFHDNLHAVIGFVQLSEFGEIDPEITFDFIDLWQLDAQAKGALELTKAQTHEAYVNIGAVSPEEVRESVANDPDSEYAGLDLSGPPPEPPQPPSGEPGGMESDFGMRDAEATDNAHQRSWREHAEALFGERPISYWAMHAEQLFGEEVGASWTERAKELIADPSEAPEGVWLTRLRALRAIHDDGDDGAEDADADTWSEEKHPRDPTGKFAKAGTASPKIVTTLKSFGYEKHPDFPGTEVYYHAASGHHIAFKPQSKSDVALGYKASFWKHLPPSSVGKPSKIQFSSKKLSTLLSGLHGQNIAEPPTPPSPKQNDLNVLQTALPALSKADADALVKDGFTPYDPATEPLLFADAAPGMAAFKKGDLHVAIYPDGEWLVGNAGSGDVLANGLHEPGKLTASQAVKQHEAKQTAVSLPPNAPTPSGTEQSKWKGDTADRYYYGPDNDKLKASVVIGTGALNKGDWQVWMKDKSPIVGAGASALADAIDHHLVPHLSALGITKAEPKVAGTPIPGYKGPLLAPPGLDPNTVGIDPTGAAQFDFPGNGELILFGDSSWYLKTPAGSKSGNGQEELNKAFEALHPRGEGGKFAKGQGSETPAAKPDPVAAPLDANALTKIGEQKGSNPGGVYQDAQGKQYYVKHTPSPDHAKNELLAAKLYTLAGANTFTYHPVGDTGVATDMQDLKSDNVSKLTPEQRAEARKDFATHAWLANWDAAGLTGDNIGVDKDGKVVNLDLGGSLAYRAKGAPKGQHFDSNANEWTTLRNAAQNPQSAALFKDLTPEEMVVSASRVAKVTDDQIKDAVKSIYGDTPQAHALAIKLAQRRNAVANKSKDEFQKSKEPAAPPAPAKPSPDDVRQELSKHSPPRSSVVKSAIANYKGSGYVHMNNCTRYLLNCDDQHVQAIEGYLAKAKLPATTLYRGVKGHYAEIVMSVAKPGATIPDPGFVSTATSEGFSRSWAGQAGVVFEIEVPDGSHGAVVRPDGHDSEYEVLLQRNSHFIVKSIDLNKRKVYVTLDQSAAAKAGK